MTYALPWRYSTTELKGPNSWLSHYTYVIYVHTYITYTKFLIQYNYITNIK